MANELKFDTSVPENSDVAASKLYRYRKSFISYNIFRLKKLIHNLSPAKNRLFKILPFLLHVNDPAFPGYIKHPKTPHGIYRFHLSGFWRFALKHFKISEEKGRKIFPRHPFIHGLYLMGSSGTIAQTKYSDFDYWLLLDKADFDQEALTLLTKKIETIEKWCRQEFKQPVSFFILDIASVRNNDFATVDRESSGSAQRTLLKEEFYRTFILVAGRIPYWSVILGKLTDEVYSKWIKAVSGARTVTFDPEDYIDLGNLSQIDDKECLGAMLWQIYKAAGDPEKSLIKATHIAYCNHFQEEEGLLCDKIKSMYLTEETHLHVIDPYEIIFEKALAFFNILEDQAGLDLLRKAIFIKLTATYQEPDPDEEISYRQALIDKYINEWDWSNNQINHLLQYTQWPEHEKLALETRIFSKISFLYELILKGQEGGAANFDMNDSDLKVLINLIQVYRKMKPGKITHCSAYLRSKTVKPDLIISCHQESIQSPIWRVYDMAKGINPADKDAIVYTGPEFMRIIGWSVTNKLFYNQNFPAVMLNRCSGSNRSYEKIFREIYLFFENIRIVPDKIINAPCWSGLAMLLHFKTDDHGEIDPVSMTMLLKNSWNEIFFEAIDLTDIENRQIKCYNLAKIIWRFKKHTPSGELPYRICHIGSEHDNRFIDTINSFLKGVENSITDTMIDGIESKLDAESTTGDIDRPILDI